MAVGTEAPERGSLRWKLNPVTVSVVPTGPLLGESEETTGLSTSKLAPLRPGVFVTVNPPLPDRAATPLRSGTTAVIWVSLTTVKATG